MTTSTSARGTHWTLRDFHVGVELAIVPSPVPPRPVLSQSFTGTSGDDIFNGTANNDNFNLIQGGNDTADGNAGKDTFTLGGAFTAQDHLNGGDGNDTLELDGNYTAAINFGAQTLVNVETITMKAGHNLNLVTHDATVAAAAILAVNASALGSNHALTFDGSAEKDGMFDVTGGAGNDTLQGGLKADTFDLSMGGNDDVLGGDGNDIFNFGAAFTAQDHVDGQGSKANAYPYGNVLVLDGDYSAGVTLSAATIRNIDTIRVTAGHSYKFILDDANAPAGGMTFEGGGLQAGESLTVDASAETNSGFVFNGGAGKDFFLGTAQRDVVQLGTGSGDVCRSAGGNDTFTVQAALDSGDRLDGGDGYDDVLMFGDYSGGVTFKDNTLKDIEEIRLGNGPSYKFSIADGNVAAGATLFINGGLLGPSSIMSFNGTKETDGILHIQGGAGADTLKGGGVQCLIIGGNGDDTMLAGSVATTLTGGNGKDTMTGDFLGEDVFVFNAVAESTSSGYDIIESMNFASDQFDFSVEVTSVEDEISGGRLRGNNFDADLADAVKGNHMNAGHAVLFAPNQGSLAHFIFLVVDANGVDGYQAGEDYVVRLINSNGTMTIDNFGPA